MNKSDLKHALVFLFSAAGAGACFYNSRCNGDPLIGSFEAAEAVSMALLGLRESIIEASTMRPQRPRAERFHLENKNGHPRQ